jgi:hypothetical protein
VGLLVYPETVFDHTTQQVTPVARGPEGGRSDLADRK